MHIWVRLWCKHSMYFYFRPRFGLVCHMCMNVGCKSGRPTLLHHTKRSLQQTGQQATAAALNTSAVWAARLQKYILNRDSPRRKQANKFCHKKSLENYISLLFTHMILTHTHTPLTTMRPPPPQKLKNSQIAAGCNNFSNTNLRCLFAPFFIT